MGSRWDSFSECSSFCSVVFPVSSKPHVNTTEREGGKHLGKYHIKKAAWSGLVAKSVVAEL